MGLFFQFKQHTKIKIKMYVAPPMANETDIGVLRENMGHGRNKLFSVSANSCSWC